MAALSEDVLKKLITPNARALSQPDAVKKGKITEGATIMPGSDGEFDDSFFLADTYEEPGDVPSNGGYLSENTAAKARAMTDYSSNDFNPERVKNSRMLSAIKEDLIKNPIDTTALNTMKLESAGNGNAVTNNARLNKMLSGAKMIEEKLESPGRSNPVRTQTSVNTGGGGGIDYALIKTIVNECIENKLNEIAQKGLLNEGTTIKGIGLSNGKIKLVDNKGNIFSAKLEYQGNTKDKK